MSYAMPHGHGRTIKTHSTQSRRHTDRDEATRAFVKVRKRIYWVKKFIFLIKTYQIIRLLEKNFREKVQRELRKNRTQWGLFLVV